uniref:Uncharacterized protein n=1 Tax=Meloidogyne enterolobii TaxID=390850 RepID=A0A6V7WR87_MELEN|nr:unnamed protein product [Meloidogyne enterolobii]
MPTFLCLCIREFLVFVALFTIIAQYNFSNNPVIFVIFLFFSCLPLLFSHTFKFSESGTRARLSLKEFKKVRRGAEGKTGKVERNI